MAWISANNLLINNLINTKNRSRCTVTKISTRQSLSTVYNIEVDDFHSYYVGKVSAWVHNASSLPPTKRSGTESLVKAGFQRIDSQSDRKLRRRIRTAGREMDKFQERVHGMNGAIKYLQPDKYGRATGGMQIIDGFYIPERKERNLKVIKRLKSDGIEGIYGWSDQVSPLNRLLLGNASDYDYNLRHLIPNQKGGEFSIRNLVPQRSDINEGVISDIEAAISHKATENPLVYSIKAGYSRDSAIPDSFTYVVKTETGELWTRVVDNRTQKGLSDTPRNPIKSSVMSTEQPKIDINRNRSGRFRSLLNKSIIVAGTLGCLTSCARSKINMDLMPGSISISDTDSRSNTIRSRLESAIVSNPRNLTELETLHLQQFFTALHDEAVSTPVLELWDNTLVRGVEHAGWVVKINDSNGERYRFQPGDWKQSEQSKLKGSAKLPPISKNSSVTYLGSVHTHPYPLSVEPGPNDIPGMTRASEIVDRTVFGIIIQGNQWRLYYPERI